MTSQESMLTLAQPACINKCFILHQQSVQKHEKSNAGNPISLRLRPLISPLLVISFQRSAVVP